MLPCSTEIETILKKAKLKITVHFFTGGYIEVSFENYETVGGLISLICERLRLPERLHDSFGLYEVQNEKLVRQESFIENFVKVGDVLSSWEHEADFLKAKNVESHYQQPTLYFKLRYFYTESLESKMDLHLLYNEACFYFM